MQFLTFHYLSIIPAIVLVPTPVVGSDQEGVLVSVVVSCVLLTVTGLLLLVLGVVFLLLRRQRSAEQTRLRKGEAWIWCQGVPCAP